MTQPTLNAIINFSTGPAFAQAMILDQGLLDTNVLADGTSVIVDVSDQVDRVEIARGRNAQADQFQISWNRRIQVPGKCRLALQNLDQRVEDVCFLKGGPAGQHLIKHRPQAVDITAGRN